MSARFLQTSDVTNHTGRKLVSVALFAAIAIGPSDPNPSLEPDCVGASGSQQTSGAGTSGPNPIDVIHGVEKDKKKVDFVPLFLRPESSIDEVDEGALQAVGDAINAGLPLSDIEALINKRFPKEDFSLHLFTHLRKFWAGKSKSSSDGKTSTIATAKIFDGMMSVGLKQIEVAQRWFGVHFLTVAEIVRTSLYFDLRLLGFGTYGGFFVSSNTKDNSLTHLFFIDEEVKELYLMAKYYRRVEYLIMARIESLKTKLDPKSRKQWEEHAKELGFKECEATDKMATTYRVHKCLLAAWWMLRDAPPEFFAENRHEFAELVDLMLHHDNRIQGPATRLLKNLSFLGRAMRNLCVTPQDLVPFKSHCEAVLAHPFWTAPDKYACSQV